MTNNPAPPAEEAHAPPDAKKHKSRILDRNPGLDRFGNLHFSASLLAAGTGFEPTTFGSGDSIA